MRTRWFGFLTLLGWAAFSAGRVSGETADRLFRRAESCIIRENYEEAREIYRAVIESPGAAVDDRARAQNAIGNVYRRERRFPDAAENFLKTIAVYPDADLRILADSQRAVARTYADMGAKTKALEEIKKAFSYYPETGRDFLARCQTELGEYYIINKQFAQAEEVLKDVFVRYPDADADVKANAQIMLALALREEELKIEWFPVVFANSEKPLREYSSANLDTLSHAQFKIANLYEESSMPDQEFTAYVKEWIFSTRDCKRSDRSIWMMVRYFSTLDPDETRALQLLNYFRYGAAGKDGVEGTGDDLKNPLPDFDRLTVEACGAQSWPENLKGIPGLPGPPSTKNWDDLLSHFEYCYQLLPDSDRANAEKIADYIISCSKGADGNTLKANEFFRQEEISGRGLKGGVSWKTHLNLNRQYRLIAVITESLDAIVRYGMAKDLVHEDERPAEENKLLLRFAGLCVDKGSLKEAKAVYRILLDMPLIEVEETVNEAALGILAIDENKEKEKVPLANLWKTVIEEKMVSAFPEETTAVVRGIVRALKSRNREEEAGQVCRFVLENHPDSEAVTAAVDLLPFSRDYYGTLSMKYPDTRAGAAVCGKQIGAFDSEGKHAEGIALAESFLTAHPSSTGKALVLEKLGGLYEKSGELRKAIPVYKELASLSAGPAAKADFLKQAAALEEKKGDDAGALGTWQEIAEAVLPLGTDQAGAAFARSAELAFKLKNYAGATQFYRKAVAFRSLEEMLPGEEELSGLDEAETAARAKFWKKYLAYLENRNEQALSDLAEIISRSPACFESAQAGYLLAKARLAKKNLDEAKENIRIAHNVFPDEPMIVELSARIDDAASAAGKAAAALATLEASLARETGEGLAGDYYRMAELCVETGDNRNALLSLEEITRNYPESAFAARALALTAFVQGNRMLDREKMEEAYARLICLYPADGASFSALKYLVRLGKGGNIGSAALTAEEPVEEADYSPVEAAYAAGDFGKVLRDGALLYRRLMLSRPELRPLSRKIAVVSEAEREIIAVLSGKDSNPEQTAVIPSPLVFLELSFLLEGVQDYSTASLSERDRNFIETYEDAVNKEARRKIAAAWTEFSTRLHAEETTRQAGEEVFAFLLLTEKQEQLPGSLREILAADLTASQYLDLAELSLRLGKTDLTEKILTRAAEESTDQEQKILILEKAALTYEKLQKITRAIETYRQIVDNFPATPNAVSAQRRIVGIYSLKWQVYDTAIRECQTLIDRFPKTPEAIEAKYLIGNFAFLNKNYDLTIATLSDFTGRYRSDKHVAKAKFLLGLSYLHKQDNENARKVFRQFVADHPANEYASRAQYLIGYCYYLEKNYSLAAAEYQKVISNYPQSPYRKESEAFIKQMRIPAR